jgi:hypothetical protein
MKAHIDTDGTLQVQCETAEEQRQAQLWIKDSMLYLEDGYFPRIEIETKLIKS